MLNQRLLSLERSRKPDESAQTFASTPLQSRMCKTIAAVDTGKLRASAPAGQTVCASVHARERIWAARRIHHSEIISATAAIGRITIVAQELDKTIQCECPNAEFTKARASGNQLIAGFIHSSIFVRLIEINCSVPTRGDSHRTPLRHGRRNLPFCAFRG